MLRTASVNAMEGLAANIVKLILVLEIAQEHLVGTRSQTLVESVAVTVAHVQGFAAAIVRVGNALNSPGAILKAGHA